MKSLKAKFRKNDVHEWNKNDERLLVAVEHGEVEKVASLLTKKGVNPVKLDSEGKTALHVAATCGLTDCLSVILAHGAELTVTDAAGLTALHLATKNHHTECVKRLVQGKCPVEAVDGSGRTALHYAAASGNLQTVELLCKHRSPVNLRDAEGFSPLLLSSQHGHSEVCSTLLDWGADIRAQDDQGRSVLMLACPSGGSAVELLLSRGAETGTLDSQGLDVHHYVQLCSSAEVKGSLTAALHSPRGPETRSPTSPKKSPPSIRPPGPGQTDRQQRDSKQQRDSRQQRDDSRQQPNDQEEEEEEVEEVREEVSLKEQVGKLQEERSQLLETIKDLRNITEEDQEKQRPLFPGKEDLKESTIMTSSASFHDPSSIMAMEEKRGGGPEEEEEEVRQLRAALEGVQTELLETREENRWLRSQEPSRGEREDEEEDEEARERKEEARKRERSREEDLLLSLAELQAKLTETQERYRRTLDQMEEMRGGGGGEGGEGGERGSDTKTEEEEVGRRRSSLEQEVQQLKFRLAQSGCEQERAAQRTAQEEEQDRRSAQMEKWYKEAQEEIRMLQDALRGTVTVEEAARDFKDMKAELGGAIGDLQRRLLELSRAYSDTKSQLGAAQKQLDDAASASASASPAPPSFEQQQQTLTSRVLELQAALEDSEKQLSSSQQEAVLLRREAEVQAQTSVSEDDHTRVVSSLGNAIKELEGQAEGLREELSQNKTQVDALQSRITADKELASDGSVSRLHHEATRLSLEEEVGRLTQLLQGALRKQDEMALEAAAAWQEVRESRAEREALRELAVSREAEVRSLGGKLVEARDGVSQLKQLVETHQTSEREKNKRIDDLSREVGKLKEALNSLSQLPHGASPASKRLQQSQQLMETMQQQNKQLQYQLAEINKQHSEVVSVYRTHLLYAVQGQMDEDVQKALKQILMMCKMPNTTKEAF